MGALRECWHRLVGALRRNPNDHDLESELRFHLERAEEDLRSEGHSAQEAARIARARSGGMVQAMEALRDQRGWPWLDSLRSDVTNIRHGIRRYSRRPILAVVAIVVLAIGIGATVGILALVDALLMRPFPGAESSRLVVMFTSEYASGRPGGNSYPDFLDIRESTSDVFEQVTAATLMPAGVRIGEETRVMFAEIVEPNYFDTIGLGFVHGRGFEAVDDGPVAVISNAMWLSEFGGDPSVLGRAIVINGSPFTIVGVAPAELTSARGVIFRVDVWLPMAFGQLVRPDDAGQETRGRRASAIVGRLRDGVGIDDARAVVEVVARRLHQSYPDEWTSLSGEPRALTIRRANRARLPPFVSGPVVGALAVLAGLVVTFLLIVCANISGLLLADASVRRREMAMRQALGATRSRLIRQVVVESLGLGLVGGGLGIAVASVAMRFVTLLPPDLPIPVRLDLDLSWRLVLASLAVASVVGLAVGLLPALYATRPRSGVGRFLQTRFRNVLTAMQATAAVFLLIVAGVFARGIMSAYAVPLGYDSDELVLVSVDLETAGYTEERGRAYLRQAMEQVPLAEVSEAPFLSLQAQSRRSVSVDGYQPRTGEDMSVNVNIVSPGYIRLMGVPFVAGRDLEPGERNAVLVNQAFAQRFWSGQNAVGRRVGRRALPSFIGQGDEENSDPQWSTVVGVVEDSHFVSFQENAIPVVFWSTDDMYSPQVTFHIRGVAADAARRAIARLDPSVPVRTVTTMSETVDTALLPARVAAVVSGLVGGAGLVLACIGLFGTLSYVVSQRAPEIGLRVALGARPLQVIRLIAGGTGVKLVVVGVVVGGGLASGVAPLLQSQFSGGEGVDFVTLVGVTACLALVASIGVGVPAARALRIHPAEVLRVEE